MKKVSILILFIGLFLSRPQAQEIEAYLPDYQLGVSFKVDHTIGFPKGYLPNNIYGWGLDFNMRIYRDSPVLLGFEYDHFGYDRRRVRARNIIGGVNDVKVSPRFNNYIVKGKYEFSSNYYVIPFFSAGLGLRYYNVRFVETDPDSGAEQFNQSDNKSFAMVGNFGVGIGIPIVSPLILELAVQYDKSSTIQYDYLDDNNAGVVYSPIEYYGFAKSSMEFITYEIRFILEFYN